VWGKVALHSNQIELQKSNLSLMRRLLFGYLLAKNNQKRMQCATSGVHQGCFVFKSNQTKKQSLINERLFFCLLVQNNQKMNATSNLWCVPRLLCV